MLSLILIDVQYSLRAIFSFEKGSHGQNLSSSDSQNLVKNPPPQGSPPNPLMLLGKSCKVNSEFLH